MAGANNYGVSGELFLAGDATIGAYARMDLVAAAKVRGNGHTLTKSGNAELAVRAAVENCKIVIDGGAYTYMSKSALGDVDYDTTLNAGQGDLKLGGVNSYAGLARIMEERLVLAVPEALTAGAAVLCGVGADDGGGRLHSDGLLYLDGLELGVANPDALDPRKHYTVATWGLGLVGEPDAGSLPSPWHFHENVALKRLELRADVGTVIMLQ